MASSNDKQIADLGQFNAKQIHLAGQRYTPGVEPGAPNLKIESLLTAIESVNCGKAAKERFSQFQAALIDDWNRAKYSCEKRGNIQPAIDGLESLIDTILPRICARDTSALTDWVSHLASITNDLEFDLKRWHSEDERTAGHESQEKSGDRHPYSSTRNAIQSHINNIRKCIGLLRDEQEFISSPSGKTLADPFLLIRGEWGTGKTHLLCDVTQNYINQRQPTLFVLAKNFQGSKNLFGLICNQIYPGQNTVEVVDRIQQLGVAYGSRALIIIDGVNEGRRDEWRQAITEILALARTRVNADLKLIHFYDKRRFNSDTPPMLP